jgi:hypothetical protein
MVLKKEGRSMPNWVFTEVKTDPVTMMDIKRRFSNENNQFSFQKVKPMPEELNIESSSTGEHGLMELYRISSDEKEKQDIIAAYLTRNMFYNEDAFKKKAEEGIPDFYVKENPDGYEKMLDLGKKYLENYQKHGSTDWYYWSKVHWGTKWDACDPEYHDDMITFTTAWSFAEGAILELSKLCPAATFHCRFADEAMDENSGIVRMQNGEIVKEKYGLCRRTIKDIWGY